MTEVQPTRACDLIMKGGITSGVVYPGAVLRLAADYRFRQVGGTSAGAIAAALTAAAEHGRGQSGAGFARIAALPTELGAKLAGLFQPAVKLRPLHALAIRGGVEKRWGRAACAVLRGLWGSSAGLALLALALIGGPLALGAGMGAAALGGLATLALAPLLLGWRLLALARRDLPTHGFGLCPGPTQPGYAPGSGLSDWLADEIDRAAGVFNAPERNGKPLTFGELWAGPGGNWGPGAAKAVDLRMMTTNLSLRRPNALPFMEANTYAFDPADLRAVLPARVVAWLEQACGTVTEKPDLRWLPRPKDMPVVMAARMSLSFPFLLSAVQLYRKNHAAGADGAGIWEPVLFSDGGLSSNFPIHFFDALLPSRPTFAISLDSLDPTNQDIRVRLPMRAGDGLAYDRRAFPTIGAFVLGLMNAAKDWQDKLQSRLPGYRERVVSVRLDDDKEGGLNLNMPAATIKTLSDFGERAGGLLAGQPGHALDTDPFDFDDHRWRRFLSAYDAIETALIDAAERWAPTSGATGYRDFIDQTLKMPKSYATSPLTVRQKMRARFDVLMKLGKDWKPDPLAGKNVTPKPSARLRLSPLLAPEDNN